MGKNTARHRGSHLNDANSSQITIVIGKISRVFDRDLHSFYNGVDRESEQQSVKSRNKRVIEAQQHRKSGNSCILYMYCYMC